jgi:hypothetical protein
MVKGQGVVMGWSIDGDGIRRARYSSYGTRVVSLLFHQRVPGKARGYVGKRYCECVLSLL